MVPPKKSARRGRKAKVADTLLDGSPAPCGETRFVDANETVKRKVPATSTHWTETDRSALTCTSFVHSCELTIIGFL